MDEIESTLDDLQSSYEKLVTSLPPSNFDRSNQSKTIYQVLVSIAGQEFLRLLEQSPPLLSALQGDNSEYTVFLPDNISTANQKDTGKSRGKALEGFLSLHVSPHYITIHESLLHMTNIPVCLHTGVANGPHVVPIRFVGDSWQLGNNQVISKNICCSNGIIHKIGSPFEPALPYLTVLENHGMTKFLNALQASGVSFPAETRGCTVFAPLDSAFETLGDEINGFLFTTASGLPYLQALIKVHLIPDLTMYSNLIWPKNNTGQRMTSEYLWRDIRGAQTQKLPSLLEDVSGVAISTAVTIVRFNCMIELSVNGTAKVTGLDITSYEGVVQGIDKVLLPGATVEGDYSIEQLKEILQPYVKV